MAFNSVSAVFFEGNMYCKPWILVLSTTKPSKSLAVSYGFPIFPSILGFFSYDGQSNYWIYIGIACFFLVAPFEQSKGVEEAGTRRRIRWSID